MINYDRERKLQSNVGQSQVWALGRGSDDTVGTRRETHRKLTEGIRGLSRARQELIKGDRELARKVSGVRRKKTKRLTGRSYEVVEKLVGRFGLCPKKIGSRHR
ncbi:hypothetical protein B296_00026779 [Ensete ventricosum]|uniref:Uncharacterized protein n=1 Tax=Ensete ventricosum TaxID=4639 RepID=A0A426XVK9_ENSVE|nr:hypothetical protein B296_00026779 [Ensete ventricosum]